MAHFRTLVAAGLTLLVVGGATLLNCDAPDAAQSAESHPPLSYIARFLTLPVAFDNASDVRVACLPVGAGLLWLFLAIKGISPARGWRDSLVVLSFGTLIVAAVSAFANDAWALSRGWCFQFAAGVAWASGIAALIRSDARSRTPTAVLLVMAVVAVAGCVLAMWHRSVLDIQYVRWPIGPLTITGCLAGVWAAAAVGVTAAGLLPRKRTRSIAVTIAVGLFVLALSATLVFISGRRSSFLGVAVAFSFSAIVCMLVRWPVRRALPVIGIGLVVVTALIGFWLSGQKSSADRAVSGPIEIRQAYYRSAAGLLAANPILGIGPDMTVCRVTTDLALEHAEHPHVIHGARVPALHSEWLQAALELGLPGGLLYLAIPLTVLTTGATTAIRRWRTALTLNAPPDATLPTTTILLLSALSGLTAAVVVEATSINLRGAVMPATYWTLVGLSVGLTQRIRGASADASNQTVARPSVGMMSRVFMFGFGCALLLATFGDLQQAFAHAKGRALRASDPAQAAQLFDLATGRFGADNWLAVRADRGIIESDISRAMRSNGSTATTNPANDASAAAANPLTAQWSAAAVADWEELVRRCPGYPSAGGFLGDALLGAGRTQDARQAFERYLKETNPYDPAATLRYADVFIDDPLAKIDLIRRGLRAGAVEPIGRRVFLLALKKDGVADNWAAQVEKAAADLATRTPDTWQDRLAPETIRLEAVRLLSIGELAAAYRRQEAAAKTYHKLFDENHPDRRAAPAEIDVWKIAADVRFESDPGEYHEAFEHVLEAERFAVLSVEHEYLRNPAPNADFVGGVVKPVETPDTLVPVWRLSAKLHIAEGRTREDSLVPRLLLAMTNAQRAAFNTQGVLIPAAHQLRLRLTSELVATFAKTDPSRRPRDYDAWVAELQATGVTTQPTTPAPKP